MNKELTNIYMDDDKLVKLSLSGNKKALENLIKKHQVWIYNIAISFTGDSHEAADLTQEVLIKVVTKLDSYQRKSTFRTWVYRIVKNHFLNMKRGKNEDPALTFEQFGQGLDHLPDESLNNYTFEVEQKLLVKEAKLSCMKGMLLCLNREQRLIFIIGELFEFGDSIGSEIMEMSKANFRVKLHRAKKQLYNFMNDKCGLVKKSNPCRCARKTAGFIKMGYVDPNNLYFQKEAIDRIDSVLDKKLESFQGEVQREYLKLYQEHPFLNSPDSISSVQRLLSSKKIRETFNLE